MTGSLLSKLKSNSRLPSPPGTALHLLELCQQDDVSIVDLANTLAADPALSLRLLKYANSAMMGCGKEITNIRDAVMLLGLRSVRLMALSFSLVTTNDPRACRGFDYQR
ncbi:MAG TPA: HDOD domain-containing protein, partial [Phycisphaerae bacterium]|nr:HDOD domain-containing protein [Phycisphaerae bacterium]